MTPAVLRSLQVAAVAEVPAAGTDAWWDKPWSTGFFKRAVSGPVWLGYEGLRGDQQADRRNHGGVDKAVCVYAAEHYPDWREALGLPAMEHGAFGENFTVEGMTESTVCVGDVYQVGRARVEVSQPRQPCWKLCRRWRIRDLAAQVERTGRTGFYLRVLEHGWVESGCRIELLARPFPELSIEHAHRVRHQRPPEVAAVRQLAECPALSGSWKDTLWSMAGRASEGPGEAGNRAPAP
ncbi:MAG: MOSC domain-containing protein [Verrucomicrobia bacterium]|nr:MOSC domain-containing protein [Verrucomicrobiota bacterium]